MKSNTVNNSFSPRSIPSFSVMHAENLHVEGLVHDSKWSLSHKMILATLEQSLYY